MESIRESYINEGIVSYTFTGFKYLPNKNGELKKKPIGVPDGWQKLTLENYKSCPVNKKDTCIAILTGSVSGITILDFDSEDAYNLYYDKYPEQFERVRTTRTKKGYHTYWKYNEKYNSTTNGSSLIEGIDILNNGKCAYAPPSSYMDENDDLFVYKQLTGGSEILELPEDLICTLKQYEKEEEKCEKIIVESSIEKQILPELNDDISTTNDESKIINYHLIKACIDSGILDNTKYIDNYDYWLKICFSLKHTDDSEDMYKLFNDLSKRSPKYDEDYARKTWDWCKNTKGDSNIKIGTFLKYCKDSDKELYKTIYKSIMNKYKNSTNDSINDEYESMKLEFEQTHCKIINKSFFISHKDNNIIMFNKSNFRTSYEHMRFNIRNKKGENISYSFIDEWFKDPNIRSYVDIDVYPDVALCPSNIFNMWTPFPMESLSEYVKNEEGLKLWQDLLLSQSGGNIELFEYTEKWIANMIQYPQNKSTCLVDISTEGGGKTYKCTILSLLIGINKYYITTDPNRDLWGQFNSAIANKYLLVANELSKKDCNADKMKGLITDTNLTINCKGVNSYEIKSYHRLIICTNSNDPLPLSTTDRRYVICKGDDKYIGNTDFFNKLYELKKDINFIKTLYEYYKNLPTEKDMISLPIPVTDYSILLKETNKSPVEYFIESYFDTEIDELKMTDTELYDEFNNYKVSNGFDRYEFTSIKFGLVLSSHRIYKDYITSRVSIKRDGKVKKGKIINIKGIKNHFINCNV